MTISPTAAKALDLPTFVRYEWIVDPGVGVLEPRDPFWALVYAEQFEEETNLKASSEKYNYTVLLTALSPLPFPISWPNSKGKRSRFGDMSPAAARNPLFWLPVTLRHPYLFQHENGEEGLEQLEQWQARVMAELTATGLYDPETGTWVDVLATFLGLNVDEKPVQDRVRAYLQGADDPELDSLHDKILKLTIATDEWWQDPAWSGKQARHAPETADEHRRVYAGLLRSHIADRGVQLTSGPAWPTDVLALNIVECGASLLSNAEALMPLPDDSTVLVKDYLEQLLMELNKGGNPDLILQRADTALSYVQQPTSGHGFVGC